MSKTTLAFLGGDPAFSTALHVGRPNIGDRDAFMRRVEEILDRRWLTNSGPVVTEFEEKLAEQLQVSDVIAVCNATVGLELATRALGMSGEVIVPSFTFIATAHALQWQETSPVFADIRKHDHNIDPLAIEALITEKTSGILAVHCWGRPVDIEALNVVAKRHNLKLLFDASHAFACDYHGQPVGGFGEAEVFSFHATKFINALEGGCISTNNPELAEELRYMRNFGFRGYDDVGFLGVNGKMNEISAAMGLTNLESLERLIAVNRENFDSYQQAFADFPGLQFLPAPENDAFNYQYVVAEIYEEECPLARDELIDVLWEENIFIRRYFYPGCHRMEPYRSQSSTNDRQLPETDAVCSRVLVFPTGETVNGDAIRQVSGIMFQAIEQAKEVKLAIEKRSNA